MTPGEEKGSLLLGKGGETWKGGNNNSQNGAQKMVQKNEGGGEKVGAKIIKSKTQQGTWDRNNVKKKPGVDKEA